MIWCVEDDADIRDIEVYALRSTGFEAEGFADAEALFAALATQTPALVLLDIMLPGKDGVEILKSLRACAATRDLPVIMATAKGQEYDKVRSLDLGADDYLVKPFGMLEMVSRIRAVLRRSSAAQDARVLTAGTLSLDESRHTVTSGDARVELTFKEYELLRVLLSNAGRVFTRDRLLSDVWGMDFSGETRTVDVHIRTLRAKLGESGALIRTVRGVGYKLEDSAHD
ncbi:MAG: response regulator transcription factor [Oscillospiraceae bacterium]|nr:response regulator transcription factor [Oscillospiraceae bacterium]